MRTANKKKAFLATSLASAALAGTLIVGGVAFAQTNNAQPGGLAQAIASTSDQESKIIAKLEEMKPKMEAARQISDPTERKKALDALRSEMQQWEKDNGVPAHVIGPPSGMHHRGKMMSANNPQPPQDNDSQVQ